MEQQTDIQQLIDALNPQQREATLSTVGPELIIAGAGSGKTRVLTTRIALLLEQGVLPERILALTFTKKAAEEMRRRIAMQRGAEATRLRMGTFHSVFASMLRPYAHFLGFPQNFTISDEDDALSCLKRCIKSVLEKGRLPVEQRTKEMIEEYKAIDNNYKPKAIMNRISILKNELISADIYANKPEFAALDTAARRPKFGEIFIEYRNACFRSATMDFDDILLYMDMLLANNPQVCSIIESYFDYILVDEYQDTNKAQYSILRRLTQRNKNICVVGDDSQSIYAFRGARIDNIFNFEKDYPGCKVVRLERNYRSTQNIVEAANRLIANNERRIPKKCFTQADAGEPITLVELPDEREEARYIADTIAIEKRRRKLQYRDFAVLYRTNSQSRAMEDSLIRHSIPYVIYSGTSFFERMEVKDQMAYFKLAVNPDDDESFRRVVNKPSRGIGEAAMSRLSEYGRNYGLSLWKVINNPMALYYIGLSNRAVTGIEGFRNTIQACVELAAEKSAYQAAYEISAMVGIYQEYKNENTEESCSRADNIRELVDSVRSFEDDVMTRNNDLDEANKQDATLAGYLQNVMLLSNADTSDSDEDRVNLMTVHCAKGLEFPVVFIAGMEEDLFPLNIDHTATEEEEERRLCYVAATRAKTDLILTRAEQRLRFGKRNRTKQSKFIEELMGELEYE